MLCISNLEQAYSHTITFVWYRTKKLIFEVYPPLYIYITNGGLFSLVLYLIKTIMVI